MVFSRGVRAGAVALSALAMIAAWVGTGDMMSVGLFNQIAADRNVGIERGVAFGAGPRHQLDIYTPQAVPERRPVIMFIYGGGWTAGDRATYAFVGTALAAKGYRTVIADYRLYPDVRFPAFVDDAAAAYQWITTHQASDACGAKRPIIVAGHSAGAHIGAMLVLARPSLASAPAAFIGLAGPYSFDPTTWPSTRAIFASAAAQPHTARPVSLVAPGAPPSLLLHGRADMTVKPYNTIDLAQALRANGAEVEQIDYDGIGHVGLVTSIARPLRWRAPVLDDMLRFLSRHGGSEVMDANCRISPRARN